jgi:hypothetical protein
VTDLYVTSTSRAEDASYRALADSAQAAGGGPEWRILGGHMVNLHAAIAGVRLPQRATRDADLAVTVHVVGSVRSGPRARYLSCASCFRNSGIRPVPKS